MSRGDAEARRELRGYVAVARLALIAAVAGLVAFLLLIRGNVFDPDVTSWPLVASAAIWALGMVAALWSRSRIRAWKKENPASVPSDEEAGDDEEHGYWHSDEADRAAHAAAEAEREAE